MGEGLNRFTASPLGRSLYWPFQKLLRLGRRLRHPGVPINHIITRVSYRGRKFSIESRRWHSDDRNAIKTCFAYAQYDMPSGLHRQYIDRVYREIVASGKKPLIVDCGANIGASVLWFSARYPEAHIVAVEPAPDNFALLRKNCAGLDVDLREAGIGAVDGTAHLSNPFDGGMSYRTAEGGDGINVEILSFERLMASKPQSTYSPFLLKVDIEGAEKSLFTASASLLDQFSLILAEPHDWLLPGQHTSVELFRFHAAAGREFAMNNENIASIACPSSVAGSAE